jgi:hypothetical protein
MMSMIQKPISLPADLSLPRAVDKLREKAEEIAQQRTSTSTLIRIGHERLANALALLAAECASTSELPSCEKARSLWESGQLPRVEIARIGCMVPGRKK